MAGGLAALLDDIATLLDDVSVMTKVATKKTAGVLGDDLAPDIQLSQQLFAGGIDRRNAQRRRRIGAGGSRVPGAQGGDVQATVNAGRTANGTGMLINSSRAIIYAGKDDDFADAAAKAAMETRDRINAFR